MLPGAGGGRGRLYVQMRIMRRPAPNRTASTILGVGEIAQCSVFSSFPEHGNPTAVMRLSEWPSAQRLQELALSSDVAEATFVVADPGEIEMRWFAGAHEVPLCGHGALAASALFMGMFTADELHEVSNLRGRLWLGHTADQALVAFQRIHLDEMPAHGLHFGVQPHRVFDAGRDYLVVLEDEEELLTYQPDPTLLRSLVKVGCIMTAPCAYGTAAFRFFAPRVGIPEDRASGSVIPALVEYWGREGQRTFEFLQRSGWDIRIAARRQDGRILVMGDVIESSRALLTVPATA
jgi:predicted PhzF superfamily epimerase YddE/YHI9